MHHFIRAPASIREVQTIPRKRRGYTRRLLNMHLVSTGIMPSCRNREFNNAPINYCKCQLPSPHYDHVTSYARGNHLREIANDIRLFIQRVIFVQSMVECERRISYHGCVPLSQHHAAGETSKVESRIRSQQRDYTWQSHTWFFSFRWFLQSLFSAISSILRDGTLLTVPPICLKSVPR